MKAGVGSVTFTLKYIPQGFETSRNKIRHIFNRTLKYIPQGFETLNSCIHLNSLCRLKYIPQGFETWDTQRVFDFLKLKYIPQGFETDYNSTSDICSLSVKIYPTGI